MCRVGYHFPVRQAQHLRHQPFIHPAIDSLTQCAHQSARAVSCRQTKACVENTGKYPTSMALCLGTMEQNWISNFPTLAGSPKSTSSMWISFTSIACTSSMSSEQQNGRPGGGTRWRGQGERKKERQSIEQDAQVKPLKILS